MSLFEPGPEWEDKPSPATPVTAARLQAIEDGIEALDDAHATLASALDDEATARATADTTNADAITAEVTARAAADTSEASTRASADTTNADAITAETTARAAAVTAEAAARAVADALLIPLTQKGAANGVATLDAGSKVPQAQLPAFAGVTKWPTATTTTMLTLSGATPGDLAVVETPPSVYLLTDVDETDPDNWQEIDFSSAVVDINGQTGSVDIFASPISAATATSVTSEATARAAADATEASTRAAADTTNANAITAEASARATADTNEATARAAADTSEATARIAADAAHAALTIADDDVHGGQAFAQAVAANLFINLSDPVYGLVGDGVTDNWAATMQAINDFYRPGIMFAFNPQDGYTNTRFGYSKPIVWPGDCSVWFPHTPQLGPNDIGGVFVCILPGVSGADWDKMGLFTADGYYSHTSGAKPDGPIFLYNPALDGDRIGEGNGIVLFNKQLRIWNPRILRFTKEYEAWSSAAAGTGKGHAIVWSGVHYDGTNPASNNNADDCGLYDGFLESVGPEFLTVEPSGIQQQFPDSTIEQVNFMRIQNSTDRANAVDVPSCYVDNAGGWRILELHFNGSPGENLWLNKVMNTRVRGGNYDGWNTELRGTPVYSIVARNMIQGHGGSALIVEGMDFRVLDELTSAAAIGLVQVRMDQTAGGGSFNGQAELGPFVYYRQTPNVSAPVFKAFDLLGDSATSRRLQVTLLGIQGDALGDAEVFATNFTTGDGSVVDVNASGCAFQRRSTYPTAGHWPIGMRVEQPTPAVGSVDYWRSVAAGTTGGTWGKPQPLVAV